MKIKSEGDVQMMYYHENEREMNAGWTWSNHCESQNKVSFEIWGKRSTPVSTTACGGFAIDFCVCKFTISMAQADTGCNSSVSI